MGYPACDYVETKIGDKKFDKLSFIVMDFKGIDSVDSGVAMYLQTLTSLKNMTTHEPIKAYFSSVSPDLKKILLKAKVKEEQLFNENYQDVLIKEDRNEITKDDVKTTLLVDAELPEEM